MMAELPIAGGAGKVASMSPATAPEYPTEVNKFIPWKNKKAPHIKKAFGARGVSAFGPKSNDKAFTHD